MKPFNKGFGLISMLLALAVIAIMMAAIAPALLRKVQSDNAATAAANLAAIDAAEIRYESLYGAFIDPRPSQGSPSYPAALATFNLAYSASCSNTGILNPEETVAPPGYVVTFTGGANATFTCAATGAAPAPVGYQSYTISLDPLPNNRLLAQRHFYSCVGAACDGLIHFNDKQPASAADPVLNVGALQNFGIGGSTQSASGSSYQNWTSGGNYPIGQLVLSPASWGSYPSGGSINAPQFFINLTGSNSGWPPTDVTDWNPVGPKPQVSTLADPNPNGTTSIFVNSSPGNYTASNANFTPTGATSFYHNLTIGVAPAAPSQISVALVDGTTGAMVWCGIQNGGSSCSFQIGVSPSGNCIFESANTFPLGCGTANPFTISAGDSLAIWVFNDTDPADAGTGTITVTWGID